MSNKLKTSGYIEEILIVEDSATQSAQIKHLLESHNYKILVAGNGQQALALLSEHKPSLVISDILMPGMNGYELCGKIKWEKSTEDIPVILLTSLTDPEEVIEGLSCGADIFITKPYNKEYLLSNIEKLLIEKVSPGSRRDTPGIEINYHGRKKLIRIGPQKIINLLINTYQGAVHKNTELIQTQEELSLLNEQLEALLDERLSTITKK